ncbi:unnamed protein product [Closterium sp. Naga37s-1]|nr:unnamed protein product [Closterium sp. Naga37s-1]
MGVAWNRLKKFAPQALLLLVILQVPLFSITISNRQVDSPIAVVITQLCHPIWLPPVLLSAVVYPGEVARHVGAALLDGDVAAVMRLPAWHSVLEQYERAFDGPEDPTDPGLPLLRLELVVGSYFAVGGAIAAQFRAARMPLLGYLLLLWGLLRPILLPHTYPDPSKVPSRPIQALCSSPTCLLPHMPPPPHASSPTCLLPHMPPPPHASSPTCLLPHMPPPPHASSPTCLLPYMPPPPGPPRCNHHPSSPPSLSVPSSQPPLTFSAASKHVSTPPSHPLCSS